MERGADPGLMRPREDRMDRLEHLRLFPVEADGVALSGQPEGQIGRADIDPVQARRRNDVVEIAKASAVSIIAKHRISLSASVA